MTALSGPGTRSNWKNVPLKNAIGMIKKLEYVPVSSCDLDRIPTMTPRLANRKQLISKATMKAGDIENDPEIYPMAMIKAEANSPFTIAASTSPMRMEPARMGACVSTWNVRR